MPATSLEEMILRELFRKWCRVLPEKSDPSLLPDLEGWAQLVAASAREGVAGLILQAARRDPAGALVPDPVLLELKKHASGQAAVGAWLAAVLEEVLGALARRNIVPMVVRGEAAVDRLYGGDHSLRGYVDHDLLVDEGRLGEAGLCLEGIGFRPVSGDAGAWERDGALIDLHEDPYDRNRVPSRGEVLRGAAAPVLERASEGTLAGGPVLVPDRYDLLLMLSVHAVKHSFDRLIRLVDIAELWKSASWDQDRLRGRAEAEGSLDALYYALAAAEARLAPGIPKPFLASIRPASRPLVDRLFGSVLLGRPAPYFAEWLLLAQLDGTIRRIRALGELCFTPEEASRTTGMGRLERTAAAAGRLILHAGRALGALAASDKSRP